jgi:soluble lytic murein transglycosylase-like protein
MLGRKSAARSAKTWQKTRLLTAVAALLAIGPAALHAAPAWAAERVASLSPGHEPVREVEIPQPLGVSDVARYKRIFALQAEAKWAEADAEIAQLDDRLLLGHVWAERHLSPNWKSTWDELRDWMAAYADEPDARAIYALALARKPAKAEAPQKPSADAPVALFGASDNPADLRPAARASTRTLSDDEKARSQALKLEIRRTARVEPEAAERLLTSDEVKALFDDYEYDDARADVAEGYFFLGDDQKALVLAATARTADYRRLAHWSAGLASWRLGRLGEARTHFETLARLPNVSPWTKSAAAYWASRVHVRAKRPQLAHYWLNMAADYPRTFYGLLARRALGLETWFNFESEPFTRYDATVALETPAMRRALALIQVGETARAELELRALAAEDDPAFLRALTAIADRGNMPALSLHLARLLADRDGRRHDHALYPLPRWQPQGGYTVDRALLFAVMRQESEFLADAASGAGARGLMQLMPATAREVAARYDIALVDKAKKGRAADLLLDPATNLTLAQHYLGELLAHDTIGRSLFTVAAAYNIGPGAVLRWPMRPEYKKDPLLFIESMPSRETRIFVQRVMTNYWIYRARLHQATPDLDALAAGSWPTYVALDLPPGTMRHASAR